MLSSTELYKPIETGDYNIPIGRYGKVMTITQVEGRYELKFGWNAKLLEAVKMLADKHWHGYDEVNPRKIWSCKISARNSFRLRRMMGKNVFERYDAKELEIPFTRPLFDAQKHMVAHGLTRKRCIIAGEMGTGKTLAGIEIMERSGKSKWWWVGPKSALAAVEVDMRKWKSTVRPEFLTYNKFTSLVQSGNADIPDGIIMDESSKVKTEASQRTQAAFAAANAVMESDGYVILMSGTPAPKSPVDWWSQAEICCPGYLAEPNSNAMKFSMAYVTEAEGIGGTTFPKLVGWKDSTDRCAICGEHKNELNHLNHEDRTALKKAIIGNQNSSHEEKAKSIIDFSLRMRLRRADNSAMGLLEGTDGTLMHEFEAGTNEVARLYRRLKGLATVVLKKDCLDLPDKFYRKIICTPTPDMMVAANAIKKVERRGVTALGKLRQVSDGFLYTKKKCGEAPCDVCKGEKTLTYWWHPELLMSVPEGTDGAEFLEDARCPKCAGRGTVDVIEDVTVPITSPKEQALRDLLEEFSDTGRIVISAAFTATIDKVMGIVSEAGWETIRIDGRGWTTTLPLKDHADILEYFQNNTGDEKIAVIFHPESGGMGLTLTASPAIVFYSNDFRAENRMQAEDRIHRIGMDTCKGATIIDMFCLATDELIYENLLKKRDLQSITMGEIPDEPAERS